MRLKDFSALCFDMDFTLVNYSLKEFLPMVYNITARFLVEKKGYPKHLLRFEDAEMKLMRQGLILDKKTHHILDVSSTGELISVHDGSSFLSKEKISNIYPDNIWPHYGSFYKAFECDVSNPPEGFSYQFFDSVFISPVVPLVAKQLGSVSRAEPNYGEKADLFYKDLMESFTFNYSPDNLKANVGFYFPEMVENTSKYICKASQKFKDRLKELKDNGVKLVVITASPVDYTEMLMKHAYGPDWRDYFDLVCCRARKPGFFTCSPSSRPFFSWNEKLQANGIEKVTELDSKGTYLEGHWTVVDKWIKCNAEKPGRVAYVGDSFKSDIISTNLYTSWDLFAIVLEGKKFPREESDECNHVDKKRHLEYSELPTKCTSWGSFFGSKDSMTMTAGKLLAHSDLTLSDVEVLSDLELDENFETGCFYDFDPY